MEKGVSIILCCYNSESRLPKTLEHLAKQEVVKEIPVEIIVVNNASTDNTKKVAQEEWNKYTTNFLYRVIDEDTPGQMYAREKGANESKYEYILYCDDDNWLQADYVQKAFDLMEKNARIGALGGQSIGVTDIDFPEWFSDFERGYAVGTQGEESGDVSERGEIWGAGIVFRLNLLKKVFDKNHPFINQGRTGSVLTSGDDCEICKRILLMGYMLYYDKSLALHHYIPPVRLTWAYKKRLFEGFKPSNAILRKYDFINFEMSKSFSRKIKELLFLIIKKILFRPVDMSIFYAKIAILLKNEKYSKDLEFRSIIKFGLAYKNL